MRFECKIVCLNYFQDSRRKERERRRKERLKAMTQKSYHVPVISGATLKHAREPVQLRKFRRFTDDVREEPLMTRSLDRDLPRGTIARDTNEVTDTNLQDSWGVGERIRRMSAEILGRKKTRVRWRDQGRDRSMEVPADMSLSNGTSGYSTDDRSSVEVRFSYLSSDFTHQNPSTIVPTKRDSDAIFCIQFLCKTLTCTLHLI